MGVLDQFCRFCTQKLDHSERRNIFEPENSRLLEIALRCIPLPMAVSDRYPNFTCYLCAYKLNDIAAFQSNGLSAVNFFDDFLAENEKNPSTSAECCHEVIIKIEQFGETEMDFVEEFTPKLETRSENEIEDLDLVQDKAELILKQEQPYHLEECVVNFTQFEKFSPGTGNMPAKQGENVFLGVDKESSSESQCIAETDDQQIINVDSTKSSFFCDVCLKTFKCKWQLTSHLRVHSGEKPFKCQYCKKYFKTKGNLDRHIRIHTGEKLFQCEYCDKRCVEKRSFLSHMRTHSGERPFKCEYCTKSYISKSNLAAHVKTHTGEKPFECEHCKKSCRTKSQLKTHSRIHTGEKPFECEYCQKRLTTNTRLKAHRRIHTGEKPFECEYCNKSFISKGALARHVRTHTDRKPFECGYCNKTINDKRNLVTHIRIHTGETPFKSEELQ